MTSRDFCFWLQGFFEIVSAGPQPPEPAGRPIALSAAQADMVRRHLALVFKHEIDPSMGNAEHQAKLDEVHKPPTVDLTGQKPAWMQGKANVPGGPVMRC